MQSSTNLPFVKRPPITMRIASIFSARLLPLLGKTVLSTTIFTASIFFSSDNRGLAQDAAQATPKDFANHILPLLRANCIACHNVQKAEGGLNLESFEQLMKGGDSGPTLVVGKGGESELVRRVRATDESVMPPDKNAVGAKRLTPAEMDLLQAWVDAGAVAGVAKTGLNMQWKQVPETVRPMYAMDASSDGQWVVAGKGNQAIVYRWPSLDGATDVAQLFDPQIQAQLQTNAPVSHLDMIQSIAISPDTTRIATGGFRDVKIWKRNQTVTDQGLASVLRGAHQAKLAPHGLAIAKATRTPTLEIIRAESGLASHQLEAPGAPTPAASIAWSPDGSQLWVVFEDTSVAQYVLGPTNAPPEIAPGTAPTPVAVKPSFVGKLEQPFKQLLVQDPQTIVGITPEKKVQWMQLVPATAEAPATLQKIERLSDVAEVIGLARYEETNIPRILVGTADGTVRVVQGTDGAILRTIGHGAPMQHIIASMDTSKFATIGNDGLIKAWKSADGTMLWEQKVDYEGQRRLDLADLTLARQKSKVDRAAAKVPELEKAKQAEMEAHGKLMQSKTQIMEELGKKQTELDAQTKAVTDSEAAMVAAKAAVDEAMKKMEAAAKDVEAKKQAQATAMKAKMDVEVKLATMDKTIAVAMQAIEKATTGIAQFQAMIEQEKQKVTQFEQGLAQTQAAVVPVPVVQSAFSADSRSIVTARQDGSVSIVRGDKGLQQAVLPGGAANINALMVTANGWIVETLDDGRALGWDWGNRWVLERTIGTAVESVFSDRVTAMDWSEDGQLLVVGSGAPSRFGELKILRVADGAVLKDFGQVHSDTILVAKLSPDGASIATGAADKVIRLHQVNVPEGTQQPPPRTLEGHTHHVLGLAWHDDGHLIASSSADNTLKVWDVESGTATRTIQGFGKEVTSIAFIGRTNQVVTSSADQQVRVHDVTNGGQVRAIGGPAEAVYCSVVAGRVPMAYAGGQDGVLWIWQLDNGQVIQQIK
jgi:WD40 repeat protein